MLQLLPHYIYIYYQGSVVYCIYIYLYIINVFKYLFLLSENKESYLYYYYIKDVRFSLDPSPSHLSVRIRG